LKLRHKAISEGIYVQDDLECLATATSIRVVLVEFADRLDHALQEAQRTRGGTRETCEVSARTTRCALAGY